MLNLKIYSRDLLFFFFVIFNGVNFWQPSLSWLRSGQIYVSSQGSDWFLGNSLKNPVKTIQRAANMAEPGEAIIILPGVYHEELRIRRSGKPDQPITFRAQQPGTVTITNAASPEVTKNLVWRSESNRIYSTQTP